MDRYIGLDAHSSSCTVATVGPSGRRLHSQVVETNAGALIQVLQGIPGTRHLCLEEGTHASWLYEVLSPHVEESEADAMGTRRPAEATDQRNLVLHFHGKLPITFLVIDLPMGDWTGR